MPLKPLLALALLLTALPAVADDPPTSPASPAAPATPSASKALLELHRSDAADYRMNLDAEFTRQAELYKDAVYLWTNPTRSGGQTGAVFVWTDNGRPAAVGTIFSHPENGRRVLCHEFHALARETIYPRRPGLGETFLPRWRPEAGVPTEPLKDAPTPATSERALVLQARAIARSFSADSEDEHGETWQLRLLPQPLLTWGHSDDGVLGGALFAFVTSAGTDPEVMLLLEARASTDAADAAHSGPHWEFAGARFSDLDLHLRRNEEVVWSSIRDSNNVWNRNADHTFRFDRDRLIPELPEVTGGADAGVLPGASQ